MSDSGAANVDEGFVTVAVAARRIAETTIEARCVRDAMAGEYLAKHEEGRSDAPALFDHQVPCGSWMYDLITSSGPALQA